MRPKLNGDATRGQLHWSLYSGNDGLALIGRAEQEDSAHGLATSYACQNCCPDSFYDASCLPNQVTGFPGDTTQFSATQRDIDCYGFISEPYAVFDVSWLSSAPGVASVDENGVATGQSPGSTTIRASWWVGVWRFDLVHGLCKSTPQQLIANALCDVIDVRSFSPSPLNVSTGDDASAHTMTLDYIDPSDSSHFFNFPQTFRANVGGTGQTSLTLDGFYGRSPIHTTVQARPAGSSGVFTIQPDLSGHTFPEEVRIVVPPQILLQMMHNEARDLSSSTVRSLIGWAMRNRFSDSQYFSNQTTYQAAVLAGATHDATTNGVQPELDAAASVFDGSADPTSGCQGFWSPTASQWQTVQQALNSGTTTLPTGVGIPFDYGGHPELTQIVYISSVGQSNSQNAPAFLFVRKRSSDRPAVVSLN